MNRYKILAVSFALVLIGILVIQAYWVQSVIEVRNSQFDSSVFSALQKTVGALEQKENITFIERAGGDTLVKRVFRKKGKKNPNQRDEVKVISETNTKKGNATASTSYSYQYSVSDDSGSVNVIAKPGVNVTTQTIVFASDSDMELETENISHEPDMEDKLSKIDILIQKIAAGNKDSILSTPKGEDVEKIFKSALKQYDIDIPFGIGIKISDSSSYFTTDADTGKVFNSEYQTNIFPNDVLNRKGSLYVEFPDKNSYMFSEMAWLLVSLLIFTLLIIFIFYSTLSNFKKQKKLNDLKSDFINNMTHELKTPLATIQLASDVILKHAPAVDPQIGQMASTIKKQSKRMDDDVKNILQIALLENSTSVVLNYANIDLKKTLEEIIHTFELITADKNVKVALQFEGKETISADKDLLEKALNNLIDNAVKYSVSGQEVSIAVKSLDRAVVITVTDKGSGISSEDLPFVFDKFYRAGTGNLHYNKGYGLGLSFVKKIAELHKGKVELTSEKEKGTCITLTIPNTI